MCFICIVFKLECIVIPIFLSTPLFYSVSSLKIHQQQKSFEFDDLSENFQLMLNKLMDVHFYDSILQTTKKTMLYPGTRIEIKNLQIYIYV